MNFKSLPQLLDYFKDEATGIAYYENIRWAGKPVCPFCASDKAPYKTNRGYKCSNKACGKKFTVKVGTIFENSKISLRIWFAAIYLCGQSKKGISSLQLSRHLGITQKTAWFVEHRVREMLKLQAPTMIGENAMVEADETYIGGKESNKHESKKIKAPSGNTAKTSGKKAVVGIIERDGRVVLKYFPEVSQRNMVEFLRNNVAKNATIYTDEFSGYNSLYKEYNHETVNHSLKIYVNGDIHTNTIENFWDKTNVLIPDEWKTKQVNEIKDNLTALINNKAIFLQQLYKVLS
jgi:transposase-like protein